MHWAVAFLPIARVPRKKYFGELYEIFLAAVLLLATGQKPNSLSPNSTSSSEPVYFTKCGYCLLNECFLLTDCVSWCFALVFLPQWLKPERLAWPCWGCWPKQAPGCGSSPTASCSIRMGGPTSSSPTREHYCRCCSILSALHMLKNWFLISFFSFAHSDWNLTLTSRLFPPHHLTPTHCIFAMWLAHQLLCLNKQLCLIKWPVGVNKSKAFFAVLSCVKQIVLLSTSAFVAASLVTVTCW